MARAYHTWRQDAARLEADGWVLTASGNKGGDEIPVAYWEKRFADGSIASESDTARDILAAIRGATKKAIRHMEELQAEASAKEKPHE